MDILEIALHYTQLGESMTGATGAEKADLLAEMKKCQRAGLEIARDSSEWLEAVAQAGEQVRSHVVEFTGDSVFAYPTHSFRP